jgi:dTDP-4-amino-4,6-dideoxygalactose transaminase
MKRHILMRLKTLFTPVNKNKKISMKNINLFVPCFRKEEIFQHISDCLDRGWTGMGYKTQEFEEAWKKYTGLPHAHFLNSNTSGLHLAVKILKDVNRWKDGDEIITSPITFVSSNHAIMYEKMKPVFADVDEHLCLDPKSVEKRITKKTRAILFIGVGGNAGQISEIRRICQRYKLKLILDAAHMAGTWIREYVEGGCSASHAGSFADVTVFSFQAVKNLPTADSGMICFQNFDYDQLARKLSWLGIDKDTYQRSTESGVHTGTYKWEYDVIDTGFKYNGNSIMASMGIVGLKYLEEDNEFRRKVCKRYEEAFAKAGIDFIPVSNDTEKSSRHLFQVRLQNRNRVMEHLNTHGIYPGVHYRDNTFYSMYSSYRGTCPAAHVLSEEVISLPLHLKLTNEDVDYVIEKVIEANFKYNG